MSTKTIKYRREYKIVVKGMGNDPGEGNIPMALESADELLRIAVAGLDSFYMSRNVTIEEVKDSKENI